MRIKLALKWAKILLRYYNDRVNWEAFIVHTNTCPRSQCRYYREHNEPNEDQDENMFCYKGNKLWARHWSMSFLIENLENVDKIKNNI